MIGHIQVTLREELFPLISTWFMCKEKWNKWYLAQVQKAENDTLKWTAGNENRITKITVCNYWKYIVKLPCLCKEAKCND